MLIITVVSSLSRKCLYLRSIPCSLVWSIFFFPKDLFNSLIIDVKSIVCQRLVKISSIEVRKPSSLNEAHTSTRFSCGPVLDFTERGWMINFTFVGNKLTNISITWKTTISTSLSRWTVQGRMKVTANNENSSEDKLQNERKIKNYNLELQLTITDLVTNIRPQADLC